MTGIGSSTAVKGSLDLDELWIKVAHENTQGRGIKGDDGEIIDLSNIKETGMVDWRVYPAALSEEQQVNITHLRTRLVEIIKRSSNKSIDELSAGILRRFFELDPFTDQTFLHLSEAIEKLSECIANVGKYPKTIQKLLVAAYASGVEAFLCHHLKEVTLGITDEQKQKFLKAIDSLDDLIQQDAKKKGSAKETNVELRFHIRYAIQAINRIMSSSPQESAFCKGFIELGKAFNVPFGINLGQLLEGVKELFDTANEARLRRPGAWYPPVSLIRYLSRQAVCDIPGRATGKVAIQYVINNLAISILRASPSTFGGVYWYILVGSAISWRHALLNCHLKDRSTVYTAGLNANRDSRGITDILLFGAKKANKTIRAESGLLEVIESIIQTQKKQGSFNPAEWRAEITKPFVDKAIERKVELLLV